MSRPKPRIDWAERHMAWPVNRGHWDDAPLPIYVVVLLQILN